MEQIIVNDEVIASWIRGMIDKKIAELVGGIELPKQEGIDIEGIKAELMKNVADRLDDSIGDLEDRIDDVEGRLDNASVSIEI